MSKRKLKLWCGNYNGNEERMCFATSKKKAAEKLNISLYDFNNYYHESRSEAAFVIAVQDIETVWRRSYKFGSQWEKVNPPPDK